MAVKIRLLRLGKNKQPFYRIVATDSKNKAKGKYLEKLGTYNPLTEPPLINKFISGEIKIDKNKLSKWLNNGAQMSTTVSNLVKKLWKTY